MNNTNTNTIKFIDKNITMRFATTDIKLETMRCGKCGFTDFTNIGQYNCAKCGDKK
jgi:predicted RNA-binding Zn-ribbon protein involved in translation (DUF1610 family)